MARFGDPVTQYFDDAGDPLPSGKLFFFATGTNTDLDTFVDINLGTPNTNPVILTASGRIPNIFLQNAGYNVILTDKDDVQIWQRDPVGGSVTGGAFNAWNALTIYGINDIVEASNGCFYKSITEFNQGNDPTLNAANWSKLILGVVWNPNQTYKIREIVQGSNGNLFQSLTEPNFANDPVGDAINWGATTSIDIPPVIRAAARTFANNNF